VAGTQNKGEEGRERGKGKGGRKDWGEERGGKGEKRGGENRDIIFFVHCNFVTTWFCSPILSKQECTQQHNKYIEYKKRNLGE
jgi:hypothetical protein